MMYNVCNRHPLVCVSRLMVALQLYIIQQRVSLVCAKFRICSFIVIIDDGTAGGLFLSENEYYVDENKKVVLCNSEKKIICLERDIN